jgi:hypothetical protein
VVDELKDPQIIMTRALFINSSFLKTPLQGLREKRCDERKAFKRRG